MVCTIDNPYFFLCVGILVKIYFGIILLAVCRMPGWINNLVLVLHHVKMSLVVGLDLPVLHWRWAGLHTTLESRGLPNVMVSVPSQCGQ